MIADERWLKSLGWSQVGNTFYPPESWLPKNYHEAEPLLFWVRVDGAIYIARSGWKSDPDVTREYVVKLLGILGFSLKEIGT